MSSFSSAFFLNFFLLTILGMTSAIAQQIVPQSAPVLAVQPDSPLIPKATPQQAIDSDPIMRKMYSKALVDIIHESQPALDESKLKKTLDEYLFRPNLAPNYVGSSFQLGPDVFSSPSHGIDKIATYQPPPITIPTENVAFVNNTTSQLSFRIALSKDSRDIVLRPNELKMVECLTDCEHGFSIYFDTSGIAGKIEIKGTGGALYSISKDPISGWKMEITQQFLVQLQGKH